MEQVLKIILVGMMCVPSYAQEVTVNKDGSVTMTLAPKEAEYCKKSGGCLLIPMNELEAVIRESTKKECGPKWTI